MRFDMNDFSTSYLLQLIISKATRLQTTGFEDHVREMGLGFRMFENPSNLAEMSIEIDVPDINTRDAFLLSFRFFYVMNEGISLGGRLSELATRPELSQEWRDHISQMIASYEKYLNGFTDVEYFESRGEILRVGLYGGLVHANAIDTVQKYQAWTGHAIDAGLFQQEFTVTLLEILRMIYALSEITIVELERLRSI